jgi:DNA-binding NtrC family response regulator
MRTPKRLTVPIRLHAKFPASPTSALFFAFVYEKHHGTDFAKKTSVMKPRILIVDDDSQITQQLYWTLCDEYDVVTANDMQTAIRRATFYKPDISILDLQMPPEKDSPAMGLRLIEYIKGHLANSKVLIMSSNTDPDVRKACVNAGADGFFAKPFELEDMLASICRLTPVHRLELFAQIL